MSSNKRQRTASPSQKRAASRTSEQIFQVRPDQNATSVAKALMKTLPSDATLRSKESKVLVQAFGIVKAELQHRANLLSIEKVEKGQRSEIIMSDVSIPADVAAYILSFVSTYEMVHNVSLVNQALLGVTRMPQLWQSLGNNQGLLEGSTTVTNMTHLIELLSNSQFASIKTLIPSNKVQMRAKALEQIAERCPKLQMFDAGFDALYSAMKITDQFLCSFPDLFPHFNGIRFNTYKVTHAGMVTFFEKMAGRLVTLRIFDSVIDPKNMMKKIRFSDKTLAAIAKHCRNLQHFEYNCSFLGKSQITEKGIIALLDGCTKLRHLSLLKTPGVGLAAFRRMDHLNRLYVVEHPDLLADRALIDSLNRGIEHVSILTQAEHTEQRQIARLNRKSSMVW